MLCLLSVPVLALGTIGVVVGRKKSTAARVALALGGATIGLAIGVGALVLTFFEDTVWGQTLELSVAPGFAHEWVIVVEDPAATEVVEMEGLIRPRARVTVPSRGGVLRVHSLGDVGGGGFEAVRMPDGASSMGMAARNLPPSLGSGRLLAVSFARWPGTEPDLGMLDDAQLEARIRELEAER